VDIFDADPNDPDKSIGWVTLLYGATMTSIQSFERSLAHLSIVVNADPSKQSGDFWKDYRRVWDEHWRAFQKDSAGQTLRKRLKGKIPDDLYERLDALITTRRNTLAHRFMIERVERDDDGEARFRRGTILELLRTYIEVRKLSEEVVAEAESARARLPDAGPVPPEAAEAIEDLIQFTMFRKVRREVLERTQARERGEEPSE
jgi:hypothetical protein